MHNYVETVLNDLTKRYRHEKEFLQAVTEVLQSLIPVLERHPIYRSNKLLERIVEPDRVFMFKVPWTDDRGELQINRGYRVQFNNALGPYKGGLRFHDSVTLSILKFLGFEQIFKNSLTTLPMGGGKGGSDFSTRGKSDQEVMRFCQSFMTELHKYIGPNRDVPAGDIGVGARELGYLYGQYKRLTGRFEGVLTGKGLNWGGSVIRPEATGFGAIYFAHEVLKKQGEQFEGKTISLSGFGNVAWGAALKATELGGKVVTLSGPDGYIYDPEGISGEKIDYMLAMRASCRDLVKDYADRFKVTFVPNQRPWCVPVDLAIPCATQNELNGDDAKQLLKNGCKYVIEASNMGCTLEAIKIASENAIYAPGKAVNAGGVAVSGLEMSQNSLRYHWSEDEVDCKLKEIMETIHDNVVTAAEEYGATNNYTVGANIAGFKKVADTMIDLGYTS